MAAVGVAGGVGVVLEEVDLAADALLAEPLLGAADEAFEVALPRLVVHDEVGDRVALRGGVLGVAADVEVEAGAVLEEDVARASPRHDPTEQVAGDLVGAQAALAAQSAGDPVLVLESEDPALHRPKATAAPGRVGTSSVSEMPRRSVRGVCRPHDGDDDAGERHGACAYHRVMRSWEADPGHVGERRVPGAGAASATQSCGDRRPPLRRCSTASTDSPWATWLGSTCTSPRNNSTTLATSSLRERSTPRSSAPTEWWDAGAEPRRRARWPWWVAVVLLLVAVLGPLLALYLRDW